MYELQSVETKHAIESACDIKLNLLTTLSGEDFLEEIYDIEPPNEWSPHLALVVMHRRDLEPEFIISYDVLQIPCPGLHTSEEENLIFNDLAEFPKPIGVLTKEIFESTIESSVPFIRKFVESKQPVE